MNFKQTTGKTIGVAFAEFHKANPEVFKLFDSFCWEILRARKKISAKLIINRIRWEIYMTTEGDDKYKINDAFSCWYARLWLWENPQYRDKIELREIRDGENENFIILLALGKVELEREYQQTIF
jgi:hypothetical protein